MRCLSEKIKSMLQSKRSEQFDIYSSCGLWFSLWMLLPNSFFLFPQKTERAWKRKEKYRWPASKAKGNENIDCFSLIKGQWKLFKGRWKVREISTFRRVATPKKLRFRIMNYANLDHTGPYLRTYNFLFLTIPSFILSRLNVVLNRTVVDSDWRLDNLYGSNP